MMTNARKQAHKKVERWIDISAQVCTLFGGPTVRNLLAAAEELYEEGKMTRAEYRIAIYELTMMEESK